MKPQSPKKTSTKQPTLTQRLRRILIPVDFSEGAKLALEEAIAYAREFKGELTLLHIVQLPYLGIGFDPKETFALESRMVAETSEQLGALVDQVKRRGLFARAAVRVGRPVSEIVETAKQGRADLIVMGSRGRTGMKSVLLGSVAEGVVRHATCPVLVVRKGVSKGS